MTLTRSEEKQRVMHHTLPCERGAILSEEKELIPIVNV